MTADITKLHGQEPAEQLDFCRVEFSSLNQENAARHALRHLLHDPEPSAPPLRWPIDRGTTTVSLAKKCGRSPWERPLGRSKAILAYEQPEWIKAVNAQLRSISRAKRRIPENLLRLTPQDRLLEALERAAHEHQRP